MVTRISESCYWRKIKTTMGIGKSPLGSVHGPQLDTISAIEMEWRKSILTRHNDQFSQLDKRPHYLTRKSSGNPVTTNENQMINTHNERHEEIRPGTWPEGYHHNHHHLPVIMTTSQDDIQQQKWEAANKKMRQQVPDGENRRPEE